MPTSTSNLPRGMDVFGNHTGRQHIVRDNTSSEQTINLFGEDGFTFGDIIDIVNPLQHIPIVSSIYRKISGDTIAPAMEIAGGALFGGPLGAAMSAVTTGLRSYFSREDAEADTTTMDPTTVADKTPHTSPDTINDKDYTILDAPETKRADNIGQINRGSFSYNLMYSNKSDNAFNSINTLRNKQAYQASDAIKAGRYGTESYENIDTSPNKPGRTIDITIGSIFSTG